jgi:CheY-like chemotaxis protein
MEYSVLPKAWRTGMTKPRALVVEDDSLLRALYSRYISSHFKCDKACNGQEASRCVSESIASGKPYRVILMDQFMPGGSGVEAIRRIRELECEAGLAQKARIVMITSDDMITEKRLNALGCEVEAVVIKPLVEHNALELLDKLTDKPV